MPRLTPGRALVIAAALLVASCSNGTDAVPSLGTGPDRLVGDKSPGALLRIADATRAGGDSANAIGLYRRAHELAPKDPTPLARLGAALAETHAYTEAVTAYRQAQALAPQDPEIGRGLGAVLLALGKPQLALTELTAAQAQHKDDPHLLNLLGVAYDQTGRHDLAQKAYADGLRAAPDNLPLRNNLGLSQALSGDFAAAEATLGDAVKGPAATPRARQNLALVYGLAGDTDKAAAVARGDLDEASVKNNLAYYALLRGMDDSARAAAIIGGRSPVGLKMAELDAPRAQRAETLDETLPERSPERPKIVTAPLSTPVTATAAAPADATRPSNDGAKKPHLARAAVSPKTPAASTATGELAAGQPPVPLATTPGSGAPTVQTTAAIAESAGQPVEAPPPVAETLAPSAAAAAPAVAAPAPTSETPAPSGAAVSLAPAPSRRGVFLVQLAAFRTPERAQEFCGELAGKGYAVAVATEAGKTDHKWYFCRSTEATDRDRANALVTRLRDEEKVSALLIPTPPTAQN